MEHQGIAACDGHPYITVVDGNAVAYSIAQIGAAGVVVAACGILMELQVSVLGSVIGGDPAAVQVVSRYIGITHQDFCGICEVEVLCGLVNIRFLGVGQRFAVIIDTADADIFTVGADSNQPHVILAGAVVGNLLEQAQSGGVFTGVVSVYGLIVSCALGRSAGRGGFFSISSVGNDDIFESVVNISGYITQILVHVHPAVVDPYPVMGIHGDTVILIGGIVNGFCQEVFVAANGGHGDFGSLDTENVSDIFFIKHIVVDGASGARSPGLGIQSCINIGTAVGHQKYTVFGGFEFDLSHGVIAGFQIPAVGDGQYIAAFFIGVAIGGSDGCIGRQHQGEQGYESQRHSNNLFHKETPFSMKPGEYFLWLNHNMTGCSLLFLCSGKMRQ